MARWKRWRFGCSTRLCVWNSTIGSICRIDSDQQNIFFFIKKPIAKLGLKYKWNRTTPTYSLTWILAIVRYHYIGRRYLRSEHRFPPNKHDLYTPPDLPLPGLFLPPSLPPPLPPPPPVTTATAILDSSHTLSS